LQDDISIKWTMKRAYDLLRTRILFHTEFHLHLESETTLGWSTFIHERYLKQLNVIIINHVRQQ